MPNDEIDSVDPLPFSFAKGVVGNLLRFDSREQKVEGAVQKFAIMSLVYL
jgi:hypothetical protein